MTWVRTNWDAVEEKFISPDLTKVDQEMARQRFDQIRDRILHFDTTLSKTVYSLLFFTILILANFCLFPISLAFSRRILREIAAVRTTFTSFALLLTNLVLIGLLSGVFLVLLWVIALPSLWFGTALVLAFLWECKLLYLALLPVAIPLAWAFSPPAIKSIALIAFCPSGLTFLVSIFTLITLGFRRKLHAFVSAVIFRCATKGPLVILCATIVLIVGLITFLTQWLSWPS